MFDTMIRGRSILISNEKQLHILAHLGWGCIALPAGPLKGSVMYVLWTPIACIIFAHCSSQSLAYEIAPFNVKLTIFQCSIEIGILTNLVTSVPPIVPAYSPSANHAPLFRMLLNRLIPRLPNTPYSNAENSQQSSGQANPGENGPFSVPEVISTYPPLSTAHMEVLTAETVYAITAIAGHENPPSRHIVGQEGVASVKEKLKTVSEELEDFIQSSFAVDYAADGAACRPPKDDGTANDTF